MTHFHKGFHFSEEDQMYRNPWQVAIERREVDDVNYGEDYSEDYSVKRKQNRSKSRRRRIKKNKHKKGKGTRKNMKRSKSRRRRNKKNKVKKRKGTRKNKNKSKSRRRRNKKNKLKKGNEIPTKIKKKLKKFGWLRKNWENTENKEITENRGTKEQAKRRFLCGGALISNKHVLTAAHCTYNANPHPTFGVGFQERSSRILSGELRVRLGAYNLKEEEDSNFVTISEILRHPKFDTGSSENDFAILTLSRYIKFSYKIQPICLPVIHERYNGRTATVTGWGTDYYDSNSSEYYFKTSTGLKETKVLLVPSMFLKKKDILNINDGLMDGIGQTKLCAVLWYEQYRGLDTWLSTGGCRGDSGGPLTMNENKRYLIYT